MHGESHSPKNKKDRGQVCVKRVPAPYFYAVNLNNMLAYRRIFHEYR